MGSHRKYVQKLNTYPSFRINPMASDISSNTETLPLVPLIIPKESQANSISHKKLKSKVFELSIACPYDQGNPNDCPLCQIRKQSPKDRYAWVEQLGVEEAEQILTHHKLCLAQKEGCCQKAAS